MMQCLDGQWLLGIDPDNRGKDDRWWAAPVPDGQTTKVPWIIQDAFPGYHGVAWYWRTFVAPANPHPDGRYLLRFWAVDYLADVWLNDTHVGGHEGGETPFVLDVTEAVVPDAETRLAVRVLNPTSEPIDPEAVRPLLLKLKRLIRENDFETASHMEDLCRLSGAGPLAADCIGLRKQLEHFDFRSAARSLAAIAETLGIELKEDGADG